MILEGLLVTYELVVCSQIKVTILGAILGSEISNFSVPKDFTAQKWKADQRKGPVQALQHLLNPSFRTKSILVSKHDNPLVVHLRKQVMEWCLNGILFNLGVQER